jgi:hypothetical protein
LHPKLLDFCKKLYEYDKTIELSIYTNFSKSIEFYYLLINNFNIDIISTWHTINNTLNNEYITKTLEFSKMLSVT